MNNQRFMLVQRLVLSALLNIPFVIPDLRYRGATGSWENVCLNV
jgi:hypothetical protein